MKIQILPTIKPFMINMIAENFKKKEKLNGEKNKLIITIFIYTGKNSYGN